MMDFLWTVLIALLLILAIVAVAAIIIALIIGIRSALDGQVRRKQIQARHERMGQQHDRMWAKIERDLGPEDNAP